MSDYWAMLNDDNSLSLFPIANFQSEDALDKTMSDSGEACQLNSAYLTCEFCILLTQESETLRLSSCNHIFCRDCLRTLVGLSTGKGRIECPADDCPFFLLDVEAEQLVSTDVFKKYLKHKGLSDGSERNPSEDGLRKDCLDKHCPGSFVISHHNSQHYCIICGKVNCLNCNMAGTCECGKLKQTFDKGGEFKRMPDKFKAIFENFIDEIEVDVDAEEWEATWNAMCEKYKSINLEVAPSSIPMVSIDEDEEPTPGPSRVLGHTMTSADNELVNQIASASSQRLPKSASVLRFPTYIPQVSETLIRSLPYKAEYAKRKGMCKECGGFVQKEQLRMAQVKTQLHGDSQEERWYHWECFFKLTLPKSVGDIGNFEMLRWEDQQKMRKLIGGVSFKDYLVESAPSAKSYCVVCDEKIDAGAIRISKLGHGDGEMGVIGSFHLPRHFHLDCFLFVDDEFELPDDFNNLPGFVNLCQDDQEIVTLILQRKWKKEIKVEVDVEVEMDEREKRIKESMEIIYAMRDLLSRQITNKKMKGKDVAALLKYNQQHVTRDTSTMLDRLAEAMAFGALTPCAVCETGQIVYRSGIGYQCSGQVSEFTKCLRVVEKPQRKEFCLPPEMIQKEILGEFVFEGVRDREIPRHAPIVEAGGAGGRLLNMSPLEGFQFVISAIFPGNVKRSISKVIAQLSGTVVEKLSADVAALISTEEEVESESLDLTEAWSFQIPVVSMDFIAGMSPERNVVGWMKRCLISEYTRLDSIETHLKKVNNEFARLLERRKEAAGLVERKEEKMVLQMKHGCVVDPDCPVVSYTHVYQEEGLVYSVVLNKTDSDTNVNSYHKIQLLKHDHDQRFFMFRSWGRIGSVGGSQLKQWNSKNTAMARFHKEYKLKTGGNMFGKAFVMRPHGYMLMDVSYQDEEAATKKSLESKLPKSVQDLIALIFDVKQMKETLLHYELDFRKMPLGKISLDQIMRAFVVLNELMETLKSAESDRKERLVADCTNRFFSLIPHCFGVESVPMLANKAMVREKLEMLDQLMDIELAYDLLRKGNAQGGVTINNHYNLLNAAIEPLSQTSEEFRIIEQYLRNTHGTTHSMYKLNIRNVFQVKRKGETERFSKFSNVHNHQLLWHGSRTTNFAGILSQGLRIAPTEAPSSGYMFGKGIYFADMVSKSANYCQVQIGGSGLLLLCEVALGNPYKMTTSNGSLRAPPTGCHSVHGVGQTCPNPNVFTMIGDGVRVPYGPPMNVTGGSLLYNEYIVYDVAQVKIRYILMVDFANNGPN